MGSTRRIVASTVADLLGIPELRARALMGPKGPLAGQVVERPNPHHYSGPKMRVVPLEAVMAWADEHGEALVRWQSQRDRTAASRERREARIETPAPAPAPTVRAGRVLVVELADGDEPPRPSPHRRSP